jgi:hypothetical protein
LFKSSQAAAVIKPIKPDNKIFTEERRDATGKIIKEARNPKKSCGSQRPNSESLITEYTLFFSGIIYASLYSMRVKWY